MCGIVAISGNSEVSERLIGGLERLEYRGYDSAGIAISENGSVERRRAAGKIARLRDVMNDNPIEGFTGIAHTRWATHGRPNEINAHPHMSGRCAIVHNGIIENYQELRREMETLGRAFESDTDSETIAQVLNHQMDMGLNAVDAFEKMLSRLTGAFAIAAVFAGEQGLLLGARRGSPLVLGYGDGEMYLGSDAIALAPLTREVTYLEDGDWVVAHPDRVEIRNPRGQLVNRPRQTSKVEAALIERGDYDHFMLKEIHEQPNSLARSIIPYIDESRHTVELGAEAEELFADADRAVAVSCGTAYYAAATAKYWFEDIARLQLEIDIASEFRYRNPVLPKTGPALFVSQSGETADTLAALRFCIARKTPSIAFVNVPESSIAREATALLPTRAGPEIGVASTKAFTAQLAVLALTAVSAAKARGMIDHAQEEAYVREMLSASRLVAETLRCEEQVRSAAHVLSDARDVLYLGRGPYQILALEGALKLKEITYIHAEGYAAGELKHGPIALVQDDVPVVVVAPKDHLFGKTLSNMEEVQARGAKVILISDEAGLETAGSRPDYTIEIPSAGPLLTPILAAIPIQLLAYHTAVIKGTDVDQPRNLAKSVTVE